MPPFALLALLALYWSRQVCIRALPAASPEYFEDTASGNLAFPVAAAGAAAGFAATGFAGAAAGAAAALGAGAGIAAGAGIGAGAAAGVATASEPHSALRKSFHFWPLSVPAVCAVLYLALHSFIVSALADVPHRQRAATTARWRAIMEGAFQKPTLAPDYDTVSISELRIDGLIDCRGQQDLLRVGATADMVFCSAARFG